MKYLKIKCSILVLVSLFLISCNATRTAIFDSYSYQKATELKVVSSNLMDQATSPFQTNKAAIDALLLDVEKLIEYEKNKPNNAISFEMWKILNNKEKNLLAGFFKRWEAQGQLSSAFLQESKQQILSAFDLIIQYEIKKDKESKDKLIDLINLNK